MKRLYLIKVADIVPDIHAASYIIISNEKCFVVKNDSAETKKNKYQFLFWSSFHQRYERTEAHYLTGNTSLKL